MLSRSRTVTAWSSRVSKSTVMQNGVPISDLKLHDIPNTVAKAAVEATRMGVKMFNVHASGSLKMMRTTVKEVRRVCRQEKRRAPIMLAVTVLTSLNQDDLKRVGVDERVAAQVVRLALLTREAGMDGVVASPQEVADIRERTEMVLEGRFAKVLRAEAVAM